MKSFFLNKKLLILFPCGIKNKFLSYCCIRQIWWPLPIRNRETSFANAHKTSHKIAHEIPWNKETYISKQIHFDSNICKNPLNQKTNHRSSRFLNKLYTCYIMRWRKKQPKFRQFSLWKKTKKLILLHYVCKHGTISR